MKNTDADTDAFPIVIALLRFLDNCNIYFGRSLRILVSEKNASSGDESLIRSINRDLIKRRIASQLLINSPIRDFRWSLIRRSSRLNFDKQAGPAVYTESGIRW